MSRLRVSAVVVHYHAASLATRAIDSLRREAAATAGSGVDLEVLVVDNGSSADERRLLARSPCRLLEPGANLGFAGGVNLGAAAAAGDVLLFANPDVEMLGGSLEALLAALAAGADVAGPRFVWDRERRFLLPPVETRSRSDELWARLALRGPRWARRARRRWRRHAHRHWLADRAIASPHLPGALLAVRRQSWHRAGPFDAGYPLYFEETDWLRRAAARGLRLVHEPRAVVLHHYNRSAAGEPRAAAWFAASEARFAARWYGPVFRRVRDLVTPGRPGLDWPPELPAVSPHAPPRLDFVPGLDAADDAGWIELSPAARGFPAAAERLQPGGDRWQLPGELSSGMEPGRWRLARVGPDGSELAAWSFTVPDGRGDGA